jgi:phosphoribosylformylglycinamidine synthase
MLVGLLAAPSIASKQWVWQQYDHMVRLNALVSPGADGAVLRLPEDPDRSHQVGVVLSTDGPGRYGTLDPWTAGALAVAESARNVACMGARPLAITNCLNFASPERPETMSDFARVVRGIGDACRAFGIPVTGGNVSFYNEAPGGWVHPTPVVGMVGVIEDAYAHRPATARSGQVLILLGETKPELGGSEVLLEFQQRIAGMPPAVDLNAEVALVRLLCNLRLPGHVHDISEGGLGVALAETCVRARCGAKVELPPDTEPLWALFGESTARAIVACEPDHAPHWLEAAAKAGIRTHVLGRMKGQSLEIDDLIDVWVAEIRQAHESTLRMTMEQ